MTKYLLAIDPCADTPVSDTGVAYGAFEDDSEFELLWSGIISGGFSNLCSRLRNFHLLQPENTDVVVVEDYKVFNTFGDPTPLKAIGVMQYLRPDVVLQVPSGKNTLVPDSTLKRLGYWRTIGEGAGHHRDEVEAIRHALVWLARSGHTPTLRQLSA